MYLPVVFVSSLTAILCQKSIFESIYENNNDGSLELLLQEIMLKTLEPYKCIAITMDPVYSEVFDAQWFEKFSTAVSYIMIHVQENEDLLSPNDETRNSLLLAKKESCQLYIILIANGIEAARLLRFGERYRILNTYSKYILLYDNRLFEKSMLYIWKRIINIVFIRKYEVKNQNLPPWYELSTVTFPQPGANVFVPWRLDIWTNSKLRKGVSLFRDKTTDLQNQTLRVVAFQHLPGVTKTNTSSLKAYRATITTNDLQSNITYFFNGVEIEILYAISKAMNFFCELYEPENVETELWGRKLPGGVFTGVIGEMVAIKADIAIGDLYYTSFLLDLMDLSSPYNTECLTFLVPESLTDVSWKTLIRPFHGITWGVLLVCLIFCIVTFHFLAKYHQHTRDVKKETTSKKIEAMPKIKHRDVISLFIIPEAEKKDPNIKYTMLKQQLQSKKESEEATGLYQFTEPVNSILYTYSMLLLVSLPKLPLGWSLRMFTGWYWLYCLLLATSYRASMTAILAKPSPKVTIDTLQELVASRLTYGGWGEINRDFFKMSTDPTIQMISDNFEMVNNSEDAVDRVADATFAFYENTWYLKEAAVKRQQKFYFQRSSLNNENTANDDLDSISHLNDRALHIMKDCIINMPVSIGLQKNSPLTPRFNKYINRILEAGLITKWLDDAMQQVLNAEIHKEDTYSSKALMNAKKFSGALVALAIGYFVSICTFIGEVIYFNYVVKKKPGYNKYQLTIRVKKAK